MRRKHRQALAVHVEERGVAKLDELPAEERPQRHVGLTALDMSLEKVYRKRIDYFADAQRVRHLFGGRKGA